MSLPRDLLDQAKHLVTKEPKRPKQASLRRAVSTAYYALFHLLTEAAVRKLVRGAGAERSALRVLLRRAFVHGDMKQASIAFRSAKPAQRWKSAVGSGGVSAKLVAVADAFVELQEARHDADYDLSRIYTRREAADLVKRTQRAFAAWTRCRENQDAHVYLVALLVHARLKG